MNPLRSRLALRGSPQPWLVLAVLVVNIAAVAAVAALCPHEPHRAALGATTLAMLLAALP